VSAAVDSYQQTMALYRQVVLGAFSQVADTLKALEYDAVALRAQDAALASAKQALHLVQINYEAGLNTYLDVLIADEQYHQALTNDLQATAVRYQDTSRSMSHSAAAGGRRGMQRRPAPTRAPGNNPSATRPGRNTAISQAAHRVVRTANLSQQPPQCGARAPPR